MRRVTSAPLPPRREAFSFQVMVRGDAANLLLDSRAWCSAAVYVKEKKLSIAI
jgi:hypothetical protein